MPKITGNLNLSTTNTGLGIIFGATDATPTPIGATGVDYNLQVGGDVLLTVSGTNGAVAFYGGVTGGLKSLTVDGVIKSLVNTTGTGATLMDSLTVTVGGAAGAAGSTYNTGLNIKNATYNDKGDVTIFSSGAATATATWEGGSIVTIDGTLKFGVATSHLTITGANTAATVKTFDFVGATHTVKVDNAATLTVKENAVFTGTDQILNIGDTAASTVTFEKELKFTGASTAALVGDTGNVSALTVGSLVVGDDGAGTVTSIDTAGLNLTVLGATVINDTDVLQVDGLTDVFTDVVTINAGGTLTGKVSGAGAGDVTPRKSS